VPAFPDDWQPFLVTDRSALITGIHGQDGGYLARLLLERGYQVFGLDVGSCDPWRLRALGIEDRVRLLPGDLLDQQSLEAVMRNAAPHEVYNLAAKSSVSRSFGEPLATAEVTGLGAVRMLEAVRRVRPQARFYQASSSEMFGQVAVVPQDEDTPFLPGSPYAVAKVYAHQMTCNYRAAYGLFACCGILFNHESPLRAPEFVTRKITIAAAQIALGRSDRIVLGNLDSRRDFGYAPEYVEAMWLMLQQPEPNDFVIATGAAHTVREFAELAFGHAGLVLDEFLRTDPALLRPVDPRLVVGNPARAHQRLGWTPRTSFADLVRIMVDAEFKNAGAPLPSARRC
jgi:GDPmannose 4,6-dehydratase